MPWMQPMKIRGQWWLPDSPDDKQSGTFTLDAEQCVLVLDHSFARLSPESPDEAAFKVVLEPVVHGTDADGREYSLLDCSTHRPIATDDMADSHNDVYAVVSGTHLAGESPTFDKATVTFTHLLDWTEWPGLPVASNVDGAETLFMLKAGTRHHKTYTLPNAVLHLEENRHLDRDDNSFFVRQDAQFTVELAEPADWLSLTQSYVTPLNDFLSLATSTASAFEDVRVHAAGDPDDVMVSLAFRSVHLLRKNPVRLLEQAQMLFTLSDTGQSSGFFATWFDVSETHRHTIQQLLATQYAPFEWTDNTFLAVTRAADAFHRRKFKEQPYKQDQINGIVEIIKEWVSDGELQEYATRVIKGGNYFPQHDQLSKLIEYSGPVGRDILDAMPHFIKAVKDIRNGLAHPNSQSNPGAVYRHRVEQAFRWIVRACLLKEIGFDEQKIQTLLDRNSSYVFDLGELADVEGLRIDS
jgi:hypothetical protein